MIDANDERRFTAAALRAKDLMESVERGCLGLIPVRFDGESRLAVAAIEPLPLGGGYRTYPFALMLEDSDIGRLQSEDGDGPMEGHWTRRGLFEEPGPWEAN